MDGGMGGGWREGYGWRVEGGGDGWGVGWREG